MGYYATYKSTYYKYNSYSYKSFYGYRTTQKNRYSMPNIAVDGLIDAKRWNDVKNLVSTEAIRVNDTTRKNVISTATTVVAGNNKVLATEYNKLRDGCNYYGTITKANVGDIVTAFMVNAIINDVIKHGGLVCNCNTELYCSCNAKQYCSCNTESGCSCNKVCACDHVCDCNGDCGCNTYTPPCSCNTKTYTPPCSCDSKCDCDSYSPGCSCNGFDYCECACDASNSAA